MTNGTTESAGGSAAVVDDEGRLSRAVRLRWKHAIIAFVVGMTTYALYSVSGWTVDTAVFGIATLAIVVYSIATYRSDVR